MRMLKTAFAGVAAGTVTGLLGAGGGMVLVPLLRVCTDLEDEEIFPASISIILPICVISLVFSHTPLPWAESAPYLLGSALGGIIAGVLGKKIPVKWLHRALGLLILWGGWRYLC